MRNGKEEGESGIDVYVEMKGMMKLEMRLKVMKLYEKEV